MDITTSLEILKSSLPGVVFLSWPVIALGYPLFASIIAVMNDSKDQMRKLVKYWTFFSSFSLFEFAFVKITEGVPYWSSVRLVVIICCLVMTQFKGACLAYQGLARTVLLVKRLCKRETVPDVIENNMEENGSEPLARIALEHESQTRIDLPRDTKVTEQEGENSAATSKQHESPKRIDLQRDTKVIEQEGENSAATSKQHESQKRIDLQRDTKVIEQEGESSAATTSKQIRCEQAISSGHVLNGTHAITNVKEMTPPKATEENRRPEIIPLEKTQQDEQSVSSAQVLNGMCVITNGKETKPPSAENRQPETIPLEKTQQDKQSIYSAEVLNGTYAITNVKELTPPEASAENRGPETPPIEKTRQEYWCGLCNVKRENSSMLNAHYNSGGHKSKLESLNASSLDAIDTGPSSSVQHTQPVSVARDLMGTFAAADIKDIMPPKEPAEKRCPVAPPLEKAQQDKGPSPSATIKLNDGNVAEKLIKDSGSEGKLIPIKTDRREYGKYHGDVRVLESKEKSGRAAPQQQAQHTQSVKVSAARDLKKTYAAAVVKGITQPKELAEDRRPETPLVKKAQQDKGPSPSATIKLKDGNVAEKLIKDRGSEGKLISRKTQTEHGECSNSHGDVQVVESKEKNGPPASQQYANAEVKETTPPKARQEQRRKHNSEFESLKTSNVVGTGITDGPFPKWCTVCHVKLSCDYHLTTHLKGKKHISNTKLSQKNGES